MEIFVRPAGVVEHVENPVFSTEFLGPQHRRRASHVEPNHWLARCIFHLIRWWYDDASPMAAWTRTWLCEWRVNLKPSNGPLLGPFISRPVAIAVEIEWLNKHYAKTQTKEEHNGPVLAAG